MRSHEEHVFQKLTKEVTDTHLSQKEWERRNSMAVRNAPHETGTVSELADRLGVSKSEVRRLRREGLLDQAIEDHDAAM